MTNNEIAQQISQIGQMLEILDENSFKVIAYERAGRMIEMTNTPLEEIYQQQGIKGLKEIKGIGESIAEKIEELIKKGEIGYYKHLVRKVPAPILEFARIPGVGPKTAKKLYKIFKVKTISELKKILQSNKHIAEFKEKTRANIIQGIDILSHQSGRMLLSFAEPIARTIVEALKQYPEVVQADPVGSLRRMKETVGDIDLVAALQDRKSQAPISKHQTNSKSQISNSKINLKPIILNLKSNEVIERFIHETFVERIIDQGQTKATIIYKNGPQIDLEILPADEYGSLLQHFTGSKDHNIALRTYAEKYGFSISEHGIKITNNSKLKTQNHTIRHPELDSGSQKIPDRVRNDNIIKCKTEEEVYQTLKMNTPEPELRENRGEIEAALKHQLPKLITLKDIKGDLQMHSTYSDGQNTIEEMAAACKKLGYEYLAITDHPSTLGITQGLKEKDVDKYLTDIKKAEQKVGIKIFSGIEANIKPNGELDLPEAMLKKFEFVIGAVHSSFRQNKIDATARLIKAIANPLVNLIAHPSGRLINRRPGIELDWPQVFTAAKKYQKILEINAFPDRLDLNDVLIREAIKNGIKLMINTDSHNPAQLENMRYGVATARRGWATKKDIVNTYPLKEFIQFIDKK